MTLTHKHDLDILKTHLHSQTKFVGKDFKS